MHQFDNKSQLLLRNESLLKASRVLIANSPDDSFVSYFKQQQWAADRLRVFSMQYDIHNKLCASWQRQQWDLKELIFAAQYNEGAFDLIILYCCKSKAQTAMLVQMFMPLLVAGGRILLVGEKQAGIKSQGRLLDITDKVIKVDMARHCQLYQGSLISKQVKPFNLDFFVNQLKTKIAGQDLSLCTLPGVFSYGRVDAATEFLLEQLKVIPIEGRVLDFGCGAGVIGAWLGKCYGQKLQLQMLDSSAIALSSSELTLKANEIEHVTPFASDGLSEAKGPFDVILTNPPFHKDLKIHYAATEAMLRSLKSFLSPKGVAYLVANNFLKYKSFAEEQGYLCALIAKNNKFSVYKISIFKAKRK